MDNTKFIWWGILIAIGLALFISPFVSSFPDGLERVAEDLGFLEKGEVQYFNAPIPDYAFPGIKNEVLATSLAGIIGTLLMFAVGYGIAFILKKRAS